MTRLFLIAAASAAALACAFPALAEQPGNNGDGQGGCGQGQQTNGCGGSSATGGNASSTSSAGAAAGAAAIANSFNTNNSVRVDDHSVTATGGAGGRANASLGAFNHFGGEGGRATSASVSQGGAGGGGGQGGAGGNATATTGPSTSSASTGASNSGGNAFSADSHDVEFAQDRNPVSPAYAAPISIGGGVCMYTPVSAAGQGITLGFSGSVAVRDDECERRATADMFARGGMTYESCLIMVGASAAKRAGLTPATCQRPAPVVIYRSPPALATKPPVTMLPVPNPVPVTQGERGR